MSDRGTSTPTPPREAVARVAAGVRDLAETYAPPDFAEVPHADAALFLCAIDHRTGYRRPYLVGGKGPYAGSALLWALGLRVEQRRPGRLSASGLAEADAREVGEMFRIGGETVAAADVRARLWRDLARGLGAAAYGGEADALLAAANGRLAGAGGLLARLAELEAYADPLQKKSFLFAKIAARRAWFEVTDPESWEVCADNVLMRLALRSGLVHPGRVDQVRAATRSALKRLAAEAGISPPVLDDLLWERGRDDPDLLGHAAGELTEPPREPGVHWY
ncbi:MAG: hypothetical protein ACRDMA_16870 [Solirubrobacterales bacterium]